ncbi:MAG: hypothetical protein HY787_21000 [Deltaproteobacteria bacterium]|nr:hypothetical protein [Deltaproteobacteria bacterium]
MYMGNENDIDLFLYRSAKDLLSVNRGNLENACLHWLRCVDANRETDRRNYARDFMLSIIEDELTSIVEDREAYNDLITLFKDLEKIFRIANSMEGSSRAVREHLDHTIRDFLFSFYLLSRKQNKPD